MNQSLLLLSSREVSTYIAGIMMLILNITGGQLASGLTPGQKKILNSSYVRWISVFALMYVGTRDLLTALLLSIFTILLLDFLLNESSRYYLFRRERQDGKIKGIGTGAINMWN